MAQTKPAPRAHERKTIDCRNIPNSTCTLTISGTEEELMPVAVHHSVTAHGERDDDKLRQMLRKAMAVAP